MEIKLLNDCRDALDEIAGWHHDEWQHLYPDDTVDDFIEDLKQSLTSVAVPTTWILMDNDKPIGSASILEQDMETNRHLSPWLANVFIKPEFRRKRLGHLLINYVLEQAKSMGLVEIYLFTERSARLYQSLGWKTIKHETYHQHDVEVMVMKLVTQK